MRFTTVNGTATAGSDYQARSGVLTFAPGETLKHLAVQVNGDMTRENDEIFLLKITEPQHAPIGNAQAFVAILDDDALLR